jgi:Ca-activated chloride channel family protein
MIEHADVVLVIDTSGSMAGQKLGDEKAASTAFVGLLDLEPERDQVGVVRYDAEAELVHELTRYGSSIEAAIAELDSRRGTHIDKGLGVALEELQSTRRIDDNTPVIVLLTDGIHNGEQGAELMAARDLRDAGIRLFTIGLGADVDEVALVEMAGDRNRYYFSPESSQLQQIYSAIAVEIQCPGSEFWGKRP